MAPKCLLCSSLLFLSLGACRKGSEGPQDPVLPDYADWYALRSPDARAIKAAHGDIDGTLIITTGFKIYQTKDRGKTWITANYNDNSGLFGFAQRADTLLALNTKAGTAGDSTTAYAIDPSFFSVDQGATWQRYRNWTWKRGPDTDPKVALSRLTAPSGTEYSVDQLLTPTSPGATGSYYVETVGIKTSTGRRLSLPRAHIESLYFDPKSRLYVSASAALCGKLPDLTFCGDQNGILYVSKQAQP